jgi:hypothetical protein
MSMALTFLGITVPNFPTNISYIPKKIDSHVLDEKNLKGKPNESKLNTALRASTRQFQVVRADTAIGLSPIRPLLFSEAAFWGTGEYGDLLSGIGKTSNTRMEGATDLIPTMGGDVPGGNWTAARKGGHEANEMIGCMLVKLSYSYPGPTEGTTIDWVDYIVSGAANMLYQTDRTYKSHVYGVSGSQVHCEMFLAAQLEAFLEKMREVMENARVRPQARAPVLPAQVPEARFALANLDVTAKILIEKGSFCKGCEGTWDALDSGTGAACSSFEFIMT